MRDKGAQISIAFVCLVLGILISVQFRTAEIYQQNLTPARVDELTRELNTVNAEKDALTEEVFSLREKLTNVRDNDEAMKDMQTELQKAQISAGMVPVEGPGVVLTLNDSSMSIQPGDNPNAQIVHDYDLLVLVNELKASGAEAIAVNGQRLTSTSEIRCAGTLILVNWNKIGPPFVIQAIGDPDMLESGLLLAGGHLEMLKYLGLQTNLQKSEKVSLPAYSGAMKMKYAVPTQHKEKAE